MLSAIFVFILPLLAIIFGCYLGVIPGIPILLFITSIPMLTMMISAIIFFIIGLIITLIPISFPMVLLIGGISLIPLPLLLGGGLLNVSMIGIMSIFLSGFLIIF